MRANPKQTSDTTFKLAFLESLAIGVIQLLNYQNTETTIKMFRKEK